MCLPIPYLSNQYEVNRHDCLPDWSYHPPSVNRERNFDEDDTYKKQLPYIPKHNANALLTIEYKNCFLNYQTNYTGIRYTMADESYKTNAFTIHNITLGYKLSLHKIKITPQIRIENLFDA